MNCILEEDYHRYIVKWRREVCSVATMGNVERATLDDEEERQVHIEKYEGVTKCALRK